MRVNVIHEPLYCMCVVESSASTPTVGVIYIYVLLGCKHVYGKEKFNAIGCNILKLFLFIC